jgi:hypothetical protein
MYTGIIENIPTSNIDIDPCCSGLPKTHPASSDLLLNAFTASRTGWKAFALTAAGLMEIERGSNKDRTRIEWRGANHGKYMEISPTSSLM